MLHVDVLAVVGAQFEADHVLAVHGDPKVLVDDDAGLVAIAVPVVYDDRLGTLDAHAAAVADTVRDGQAALVCRV